MRRISIVLSVIFVCILGYAILNINTPSNGHTVETIDSVRDVSLSSPPFKKGERFTYEVRHNGMRIGKSILTFNGEKNLNNKEVYHITFSTKIPSFRDTEEIYADKDTFLPIEVHRKIKKRIGFNDNIVEKYDQENFRVDIRQKSKLRKREFFIQKDSPIHNAILLAYYYRMRNNFKEEDRFKVSLPTVDFELIYSGIEIIKTPMGKYSAYAFTSDPQKFRLWLSVDKKRTPLKIENPGAFGYSLVIKSIE